MKNWKKNTTIFLTGQSISLIGSTLVSYSIMWYITLQTQSSLMMTLYILFAFIPQLLLSPFSGVWADRLNRKFLIIIADLTIAMATLIVAISFFVGYQAFWLLFVVAAIRSLGQAVHQPTISAVFPQIVPENKLLRVQGINQAIHSISIVILPIVTAALLNYLSLEYIFFIDVITAILAVFTLAFVSIPDLNKSKEKENKSFIEDIKKGFIYIKKSSYLLPLITYMFLFMFLIAPLAFLTPLQVTRLFGNDVWYLTAIEIVFGVGMLLGSAIIAIKNKSKNKLVLAFVAMGLMGFVSLFLGIVTNIYFYLLIMGISGIFVPIFNTANMVLIQEKVEPNYMGRVFSIVTIVNTSAMPLGMLIIGPLGDIVDIGYILIVAGILISLLAFIVLLNKKFISHGVVEPKIQGEENLSNQIE